MPASYVLLAAGSNAKGQLGIGHDEDAHAWTLTRRDERNPGDGTDSFPPEQCRILQLAGGANHSLALVEGPGAGQRSLWAAGDAAGGQLGPLGLAGARDEGGELEGMVGVVRFTRVPLEYLLLRGGRNDGKPKLVACAWETSYVVLDGGSGGGDDVLLSFGSGNDFGQLGVGEGGAGDKSVHRIDLRRAIRESSQEVTVALEMDGAQSGRLRVVELSAGVRHACVVVQLDLNHGQTESPPSRLGAWTFLLGWGAARHGQLSRLNIDGHDASVETEERPPRACWTPRTMAVWQGLQAVEVHRGRDHTVVVWTGPSKPSRTSTERKIITLGSNRLGQSPFRAPADAEKFPGAVGMVGSMWNTTLVQISTPDGKDTILTWGAASRGQSGSSQAGAQTAVTAVEADVAEMLKHRGSEPWRIDSLVAGSEHAVAIIEPPTGRQLRELWGWGWTEHGNLPQQCQGDAIPEKDAEISRTPVRLWPPPTPLQEVPLDAEVEAAWAGCATSFLQLRLRAPS